MLFRQKSLYILWRREVGAVYWQVLRCLLREGGRGIIKVYSSEASQAVAARPSGKGKPELMQNFGKRTVWIMQQRNK